MASDPIQNFLKAQQDLIETARKQMESARREAPSPDALLADRERFTERIRTRISSLQAARTKAIERYDTEIRHQEELLARLAAGIQQEREHLEKARAEGEKPKASSKTKQPRRRKEA
jgi:flagellar biosynthesis chaperone FliJ